MAVAGLLSAAGLLAGAGCDLAADANPVAKALLGAAKIGRYEVPDVQCESCHGLVSGSILLDVDLSRT